MGRVHTFGHKGIIAVDGKTLRRSYRKDESPIHIVSAWALEGRMVLGQIKTGEKSNEITAIPEMLALLELEGCIVISGIHPHERRYQDPMKLFSIPQWPLTALAIFLALLSRLVM